MSEIFSLLHDAFFLTFIQPWAFYCIVRQLHARSTIVELNDWQREFVREHRVHQNGEVFRRKKLSPDVYIYVGFIDVEVREDDGTDFGRKRFYYRRF